MGALDLIGQKFGHLVVREKAPRAGKSVKWICTCDCGSTVDVPIAVVAPVR